jgi:hypothetical protein
MDKTAPPQSQWVGRWSTVALALLGGLACKTVPSKPGGLSDHFRTGKDARYPQDRYVTGAGQGADAGQARAAAFADIGAQLQARIESTLVAHEQSLTGPDGHTTMLTVTSEVRQHTTFEHHGLARVVDTQMEDGVVHAFAVLDRMAMAEPFLRDVTKARALLRRALEDFAAAGKKMDLRSAGRLVPEVGKQERDLATALVLAEATTAALATEDEWALVAKAAQVEAELRRLRAQAVVEICLSPEADFPEASQLAKALIDQVAALGATAVGCGQAAGRVTFRAEGQITAVFSTEAALGNAVFCRPSIELRLLDVNRGAEVLAAALGGDSARAAGRDREVATRAALKKLAAAVTPRLAEALGVPDAP